MAHEILSIKLCQLEERVGRLHRRIHLSETANHAQLRREICRLEAECLTSEAALREKLQHSRSPLVSVLNQGYSQMEHLIQTSQSQMQALAREDPDQEVQVEEKLLLAEYALDFAHQAADRALLVSLEAIDAQLQQMELADTPPQPPEGSAT